MMYLSGIKNELYTRIALEKSDQMCTAYIWMLLDKGIEPTLISNKMVSTDLLSIIDIYLTHYNE